MRKTQAFLLLQALAVTLSNLEAARADEVQVRALSSKAAASEQYERDVDKVAMQAQESAISKLSALLKKYKDTRQEPILLAKLAELQQQNASLLFRISHGNAHRKGGAIAMDPYKQELNRSIATLNTLIAKYPGFSEIPQAYFLRGKSYEELADTAKATQDYLYLVNHFPEAEQTSPAYMSLAEFSIQANNHAQAIVYLKELEKRPEDPQYPFALYKLAWSHYNIKDISRALAYAEKQIAFYNERMPHLAKGGGENVLTSDSALRENTLLDIPLFFFEGTEKKDDRYQVAKALDYFKGVESGPTLGKMALRFAKLLRSRGMDSELLSWKDRFLEKDSARPESLEIVIITYEHQLNKRRYDQVMLSAQDMIKLHTASVAAKKPLEGIGKAQKLVLDTAEGLQSLIVKNKATEEAKGLSKTLASIYDSFTKIVPETDPRIPQVHYNLAETLFAIQDYSGATDHYRWVVEHQSPEMRNDKKNKDKNYAGKVAADTVSDASLKAIAARYEVLRQKNLIATEVKAVALPTLAKDEKPKFKELDPLLSSWIDWIDAQDQSKTRGELDHFLFEANRSIYAQGDVHRAVARLESFARKNPKSSLAIPSISLVLDTTIATADWDRTFQIANELSKVTEWKETPFGKRLFEVAADSLYKKIEAKYRAKQYAETLVDADQFLTQYSKASRIPDCLSLAGAAAMAIQDKTRANKYFSKIIETAQLGKPGDGAAKDSASRSRVGDALLARASIAEEQYQFLSAASDYRMYLEFAGAKKESLPLRRKILALAWISGDTHELVSTLKSPSICTEELEADCDKYSALAALQGAAPDEDMTDKKFNYARKLNSGEARTIWSVYVLQGAKHLAFRDRNLMLRKIGEGWKDLDPIVKFTLIPTISKTIPEAFQMNRAAMKDVAPLRADERYITRRVEVIREMENAAGKIMELPWSRIRASVLNEIAALYIDLSKGLSTLPSPKGLSDQEMAAYQDTIRKLVVPFEEKGQEIRSKAFEMASHFAIEDESFAAISESFFAENPSQAKKLQTAAGTLPKQGDTAWPTGLAFKPLDSAYISSSSLDKTKTQTLFKVWEPALKKQRWAEVAFLLQEAKEKKLLPDGELSLVRAISLASVGARAEGLLELEDARKSAAPADKMAITLTLAQHYAKAFSQEKAKSLFKEIEPAPAVVAQPGKPQAPVANGERKPASAAKN